MSPATGLPARSGATFLRLPWIRKGRERENQPFPSLDAIEEFLGKPGQLTDPWAGVAPV